jgi:hypothetical protein
MTSGLEPGNVTQLAPLFMVYWYEVIAAPPFDAGADHATVMEAFPGVAELMVGAPGVVAGTTEAEAADTGDEPAAFVARTVNV